MTDHLFEKLKYSLHNLSQLLSQNLPSTALTLNPLDYYSHKLEPLFQCIQKITSETEHELLTLKQSNQKYKTQLITKANNTGITYTITNFTNYSLEKEYLSKFERRIFLIENRLKIEIINMVRNINDVKEILNEERIVFEGEVSVKVHKHISCVYEEYMGKKRELEKMRMTYVKSIMRCYDVLKLNELNVNDRQIMADFTSVNMDVLCKKNTEMQDMIEQRKLLVNKLITEIDELKDVLYFHEISDEEINDEITDNNISILQNLKNRMVEIENHHFVTIFEETRLKLFEICTIFEIQTVDFEKNRENFYIMKKITHELSLKKEKFINLQTIINKWNELKLKMINFEKSASDPKRLFKSSFQLLDEEKFRKTAYPTLLSIESKLVKDIDEFERQFGEFSYKGVCYKKHIQEDSANRIINRNVFIMNKNETPKKCKK